MPKHPEELRSHRWLGTAGLRSFGHRSRLLQIGYADLHGNQAEFKKVAAKIDAKKTAEQILQGVRHRPGGGSIPLAQIASHLAPDSPMLGDREPGLTAEGWFRTEHMT